MASKKFYDEQHARTYLIGGIIRLSGKPILIRDLQAAAGGPRDNSRFRLTYSNVGEENNSIAFLPNDKVNMLPVPLGMMDTDEETWYVQRNPSRGWKIGLSPDNISYQLISGRKEKNNGLVNPRIDGGFNSKFLYNCIIGKHPSYKEALKAISQGDRFSQAFSRQFAVNRGGLVFKSIDDTVGVCEQNKPVLFDHFQYLKEVLEEDLLR